MLASTLGVPPAHLQMWLGFVPSIAHLVLLRKQEEWLRGFKAVGVRWLYMAGCYARWPGTTCACAASGSCASCQAACAQHVGVALDCCAEWRGALSRAAGVLKYSVSFACSPGATTVWLNSKAELPLLWTAQLLACRSCQVLLPPHTGVLCGHAAGLQETNRPRLCCSTFTS